MDQTRPQPRILTLEEVLQGAERARQRVAAWPEWKRALSISNSVERREGHRVSEGREPRD